MYKFVYIISLVLMYLHFLTLTLNNVTVIELTHTVVPLQRDDRQTFLKDT